MGHEIVPSNSTALSKLFGMHSKVFSSLMLLSFLCGGLAMFHDGLLPLFSCGAMQPRKYFLTSAIFPVYVPQLCNCQRLVAGQNGVPVTLLSVIPSWHYLRRYEDCRAYCSHTLHFLIAHVLHLSHCPGFPPMLFLVFDLHHFDLYFPSTFSRLCLQNDAKFLLVFTRPFDIKNHHPKIVHIFLFIYNCQQSIWASKLAILYLCTALLDTAISLICHV